jgi:hypothetical protein
MHRYKYSVLIFCLVILPLFAARQPSAPVTAPELLSFDELVTLSETDQPAEHLAEKLDRILRTPFVNNDSAAVGGQPHRPSVDDQRAAKGFEPTFTLQRDFAGLVGRYKLDWIFVKPYITQPRSAGMSDEFAPHFPVTMRDLNNAVPDGVSDHAPITVDLPLSDTRAN